jgi:23S rRNA (cytosine1962-C5)-methyltransferase
VARPDTATTGPAAETERASGAFESERSPGGFEPAPEAVVARTAEQATMFANRLLKNARHRRKWARRTDVTCYRLYDRDIPELPLIVDLYDGALHVAEFAGGTRQADLDPDWLDTLCAAAAAALEVPEAAVYIKVRDRQRGASQYGRFGAEGAVRVVTEGGLRFQINLSDYLDTGLFLDHRPTRALVGSESRGRRVLNLYAYTGSFSVYAAANGAAATTTVDLSNTYLDWAAENLALNGFGPEDTRHRRVRADTMRFLYDAASRGERYDLVVLDPPTFSNSKGMDGTLDLQRDHADLLQATRAVCAAGAVVYFSTNRRRFSLDASLTPGRIWSQVADITARTIPPDFAAHRPHRCWRLECP